METIDHRPPRFIVHSRPSVIDIPGVTTVTACQIKSLVFTARLDPPRKPCIDRVESALQHADP